MFFNIYQPAPALAAFVKCYWILEHNLVSESMESILPDGCPELIFHFGDKYQSDIDGTATIQPLNLVVGQLTQSIKLQPTGTTGIFAVRFYPWGLYPFVRMPVSGITNGYENMEDIFSTVKKANLTDSIVNAAHQEKAGIIDAFLLQILSNQTAKTIRHVNRVVPVMQHLYANNGNVQVNDMASDANLSIRQFNRITNEVTGLSPKVLSRILRFTKFMEQYQAAKEQSLTQLLYNCGYYDQSHFIREFKDITGAAPLGFFKKPNELADLLLF